MDVMTAVNMALKDWNIPAANIQTNTSIDLLMYRRSTRADHTACAYILRNQSMNHAATLCV